MQANYSTEAKEKHSSTSKGGTTNVDVTVQTVQLDKNDDECIRFVNANTELRGNDWSDDRRDDESAFGEDTSQLVELLHCR